MASSGSTNLKGSAVVSTRRKMEVLGLILMVLALLLSLAFVTYQPSDDAVAQAAPLVDALLNPSQYPPVDNALGLLGAELARSLVPGFLGYSVLLYSGALMVWGYAIFRHWSLRPLLYPTGLVLLSAFVIADLVGWFGHTLDADLLRWAGAVGMGMAGWMQGVIGLIGSVMGEFGVNIAGMYNAREAIGGEALTVYNVDQAIPEEAREALMDDDRIV
ncbi:MAG: hypothetical protein BRD25_01110, partial [Bacteroidetes bacterium QH_1_61_8]